MGASGGGGAELPAAGAVGFFSGRVVNPRVDSWVSCEFYGKAPTWAVGAFLGVMELDSGREGFDQIEARIRLKVGLGLRAEEALASSGA